MPLIESPWRRPNRHHRRSAKHREKPIMCRFEPDEWRGVKKALEGATCEVCKHPASHTIMNETGRRLGACALHLGVMMALRPDGESARQMFKTNGRVRAELEGPIA